MRHPINSARTAFSVLAVVAVLTGGAAARSEEGLKYKQERPQKDLAALGIGSPQKYNPKGRQDPFKSFLVTEEEAKQLGGGELVPLGKGDDALKTDLQRIDLSQLTLNAIVGNGKRVLAMFQTPEGRGYFVEKGTAIGTRGGVVDAVISQECETPLGLQNLRRVVVKEPRMDREGNVTYVTIDINMPSGGRD